MAYVDGFVLTVPVKKLAAYKKLAVTASKIWKEHGAVEYYEAVGEDLKTTMGVPFPKMAKAKKGETVIFAWVIYKSRKHRDQVNKRVMADKRMQCMPMDDLPFDCNRMSYGGFNVIVKA